jgi:MFS family permease
MLIMGVASTLIGLVPGAATIGGWGAVLLVFLRVCQGIAVGGEWGGAALMALEHSEGGKRGFAASFTNAGAPTGAALGTFVLGTFSAVLPQEEFLSWGWRVPFLLSFALLIVGMVIRAKIHESPIFEAAAAQAEASGEKRKLPIWEVLRRPKALLLTMFAGASGFGLQVLLSTFAVQYSTDAGTERSSVLYAFALASIFSIFFVVWFGHLSDRFGRRPVMITGLILFVGFLFPLFGMLTSTNWFVLLLAFTIALGLHGMIYGPLAAFIAEQFGTGSRYTGASLGYQLATLLGAGFTPTILATLYAGPGGGTSIVPVAVFLGAMAVVSIIALVLTRESKDHDLTTHEH